MFSAQFLSILHRFLPEVFAHGAGESRGAASPGGSWGVAQSTPKPGTGAEAILGTTLQGGFYPKNQDKGIGKEQPQNCSN